MPSVPLSGSDGSLFHYAHANVVDAPHISQDALSPDQLLSRGLGDDHGFNASMVSTLEQQHTLQVLVTCTSSISLLTAVCAVYWFWMMRRNFRRDLVLLLIAGGSWKSLWFVIFSATTFIKGKISTETSFCQASGYMLQVGFEMCDLAVFFMSMHMYLQIFPPTRLTFFGHDGLYRVRRGVVALWLLLPNLSAALAFVNPKSAYMAQGGFCSLPLRPYWYRLALFWLPRYMIWVYIVFVAISITRYVGSEFKVFGQEKDSSTGQSMADHNTTTDAEGMDVDVPGTQRSSPILGEYDTGPAPDEDDDVPPNDDQIIASLKPKKKSAPESRKSSLKNFTQQSSFAQTVQWTTEDGLALNPFTSSSRSAPTSRRGSRQVTADVTAEDFAEPPGFDPRAHRGSIVSQISTRSSAGVYFEGTLALTPIAEGIPSHLGANIPRHSANKAMRNRRRAIQRQLRLLFIYPCIYMLLWILPFVVNCMNYFDYWAQHPIFTLRVLQLTCITTMTFVDVFVFCWRERPWRHIPGADGTLIGSFKFWDFCFNGNWAAQRRSSRAPSFLPEVEEDGDEEADSRTGLLASIKRWSRKSRRWSPRGSQASAPGSQPGGPRRSILGPPKRTFSGGSDRRHLEAERAHERLAMERADFEKNRRSLQDRRASIVSIQQKHQTSPRKDWFDQQTEEDVTQTSEHDSDEKLDVK